MSTIHAVRSLGRIIKESYFLKLRDELIESTVITFTIDYVESLIQRKVLLFSIRIVRTESPFHHVRQINEDTL